jgi:site-specific DNA-cytosine methylase
MKKIRIGTTFSGIGSPEFALKHLYKTKENFKNVKLKWACDFDNNAKLSFLANHNPDKFYDNIYYMTHEKDILINDVVPAFYKPNQKKSLEKEINKINNENDNFYGLNNVDDVDLYIFGFPCQNFSIANQNRDNFNLDNIDINNTHQHQKDLGINATKTTLVYQSMKLIEELSKRKNPLKYFIGENVKGLIQHDQSFLWDETILTKNDFENLNSKIKKNYTLKKINQNNEIIYKVYKKNPGVILDGVRYKGYPSIFNKEYDGNKKFIGKTLYVIENSFKELGYKIKWKVLNANDYSFDYTNVSGGVQNRERIFIIGIKDDIKQEFEWPKIDNIEDGIEDAVINYINKDNNTNKNLLLDKKFIEEKERKRKSSGVCDQSHFLTNVKYEQGQRIYNANKKSPCLTCVGAPKFHIKYDDIDICRELDGKEMLAVQGFPINNLNRGIKNKDNEFEIDEFKFVVSDNQLKKQAGNSMAVPVMYVILKELLKDYI